MSRTAKSPSPAPAIRDSRTSAVRDSYGSRVVGYLKWNLMLLRLKRFLFSVPYHHQDHHHHLQMAPCSTGASRSKASPAVSTIGQSTEHFSVTPITFNGILSHRHNQSVNSIEKHTDHEIIFHPQSKSLDATPQISPLFLLATKSKRRGLN